MLDTIDTGNTQKPNKAELFLIEAFISFQSEKEKDEKRKV